MRLADVLARNTAASGAGVEPAAVADERLRRAHWDGVAARERRRAKAFGAYYHRRIAEIYRLLIPPGRKVLEVGCAEGDLLAAVKPADGVGIDFSPRMLERAAARHPHLRLIEGNANSFELDETFDYIILSDLVNELWDVQAVFERLHRYARPDTRLILNTYSHLWELPRKMAEEAGLAAPLMLQNWLTVEDLENLLQLAGFEVIRRWPEIPWPVRTPLVDSLANRYVARFWPFRHLSLANFIVARPAARRSAPAAVSIVVPARNERGNIESVFRRVPEMGRGIELIFVEGGSTDGTWEEIERAIAAHPEVRSKLLKQTGTGKGDAVRLGFANSSGEMLMILDADLTVAPEDLPRFYEALVSGKAEFVNGVRLVYPMGKREMRFFNLAGNKFFSLAFSWLLGQNIKDTLCGTKALWRADYERVASNRSYFGNFDPFGDFDLIFGAAKCSLKMVDLPVRYGERVYGETNIARWRHGFMLLKMLLFALRRLKFV